MIQTIVDLDVIENGDGKNPFNELMSKIEKLHLQGILKGNKSDLENHILQLERIYQDLSDSNELEKSKIILQAISATNFIFDSQNSGNPDNLHDLLSKLLTISSNINIIPPPHCKDYQIKNIIQSKFQTTPKSVPVGEVSNALNQVYAKLQHNASDQLEEWILDFEFDIDKSSYHKPLEFINTFITGMNTIEGVQLVLEDIKVGSIKARIKAIFQNKEAKEKFKDALDSTRKFAKGKLEKEFHESEKTHSEKTKIDVEIELLQEELNKQRSLGVSELTNLEKQSLQQDIQRKKIENDILKLKLFKERKELLKELLSEGIIEQEQFNFLIKGLPFLKLENGQLSIGESIDVIDDK